MVAPTKLGSAVNRFFNRSDQKDATGGSRVSAFKERALKLCTRKMLQKRIPILEWLPKYNLECLAGDVVAGLTVGLTVLPQGIAYSLVAGLPPQYGLYSAFMGCFVYVIFGSCKEVAYGPTALMAILTLQYTNVGGPDMAVLISFIAGLITFLAGVFNLGFLVSFVAKTVISGFISAAAIAIATTQIKDLLGISIKSSGLIDTWIQIFSHITETRYQDVILGIVCFFILLIMQKMKDFPIFARNVADTKSQRIYKSIVFFTSMGRNAVVVIGATLFALCFHESTFSLTGYVTPGLPPFQPPPFETTVEIDNVTTTLGFGEMMSMTGLGLVVFPLIIVLESYSITTAFANGRTIDTTQEMLALGLCNVLSSFVSAMPTTGSFSRTAVNATSGVRTPMGQVITGALVMISLAFLTPYFKYIPKSSLAAVIICAVIFMVEYQNIVPIWRVRKVDELPLWITFFTCVLWKLEYGIFIGMAVSIIILLHGSARPKIHITTVLKENSETIAYILIQPRHGFFFPSSDHVRNVISKTAKKDGESVAPVVVNCQFFSGLDFTAAQGLQALASEFKNRKQPFFFYHPSRGVKASLLGLDATFAIVDSLDDLPKLLRKRKDSQTVLYHPHGHVNEAFEPSSIDPVEKNGTDNCEIAISDATLEERDDPMFEYVSYSVTNEKVVANIAPDDDTVPDARSRTCFLSGNLI